MNLKIFFTIAMIANLTYGLWYFLAPQQTADIYGFGLITTPLSNSILQFLGTLFIAEGVMCGVARKSERSIGRTAIVSFICVSSLMCFYLDIKTLLGEPGAMDYIDALINAFFGFTALYFIIKERKVD